MSIDHHGGAIVHFKGPSATKAMQQQDECTATQTHSYTYNRFVVRHAMNDIQRKIMNRIQDNFTSEIVETILIPLLNQTNQVSLRLLDYLVTNFGRDKPVYLRRNGNIESIYHLYKRNLQMWKRRNFDPFRRSQRNVNNHVTKYIVEFEHKGKAYVSTIGQLNFILFAYEEGILQYALRNQETIETAMNMAKPYSKKRRRLATLELASFCHRSTVDF